jgi:hypothetical protein
MTSKPIHNENKLLDLAVAASQIHWINNFRNSGDTVSRIEESIVGSLFLQLIATTIEGNLHE